MFDLLAMFPVGDLLVGPDTDLVDSHRRIQVSNGHREPVVRLLLYLGSSSPSRFSAASSCRCANCRRSHGAGLWLPMIIWLVLLNGAESIASKTTLTTKFVLLAVALYRRPVREPETVMGTASPRARATSSSRAAWRRPSYPFHRTGSRSPAEAQRLGAATGVGDVAHAIGGGGAVVAGVGAQGAELAHHDVLRGHALALGPTDAPSSDTCR